MNGELQKAINLAKKTGDRLIVFDSNRPDMTYVVMSLLEYEHLTLNNRGVQSLTEQELLDRINRDIAVWKSDQFSFDKPEFEVEKKRHKWNNDKMKYGENYESYEDENYYDDEYEEYEDNNYARGEKSQNQNSNRINQKSNGKTKKAWAIPSERKQAAEEVIEEDRQYLEEVPF